MTGPPWVLAASTAADSMADWVSVPTLSAGGLLGLFVLAILTGRLQPRGPVDRQADRQERETAFWREAWQTSEAARTAQAEQLRDLLDGSRTVLDLLRAMQVASPPQRSRTPR